MVSFGVVGTSEVIFADEWNQPKGTVKLMVEDAPSDVHVIDETGNWVLPMDNEVVRTGMKSLRKKEILSVWSITDQLEALTENAMGKPEKLNKLLKDLTEIKEKINIPPSQIKEDKTVKSSTKKSKTK